MTCLQFLSIDIDDLGGGIVQIARSAVVRHQEAAHVWQQRQERRVALCRTGTEGGSTSRGNCRAASLCRCSAVGNDVRPPGTRARGADGATTCLSSARLPAALGAAGLAGHLYLRQRTGRGRINTKGPDGRLSQGTRRLLHASSEHAGKEFGALPTDALATAQISREPIATSRAPPCSACSDPARAPRTSIEDASAHLRTPPVASVCHWSNFRGQSRYATLTAETPPPSRARRTPAARASRHTCTDGVRASEWCSYPSIRCCSSATGAEAALFR
eukprot:scaffold81605_cov28-Tisochrysis_lutea.AAC.3